MKPTRGLSVAVLVALGIMIGLIISGNFDLTKKDYAQTSTAVNQPATGQVDNNLASQINNAFVSASNKVLPSVVSISTTRIVKRRSMSSNPYLDEFFREFFQVPEGRERTQKTHALGSGVIVSDDGYILTNHHVISRADEIKITLFDDTEYDAELIGSSEEFDIAVLKVDAENIRSAGLGNSDNIVIGEWVLAMGSPFSQSLRHTVTQGIISGKGRNPEFGDPERYENYIQTSAPINPGNSGGALVNLKGELIGINTAIVSSSGGNQGIGFAIPVNTAKKVMDDLIKKGKVVRGWLGVSIGDVSEELAEALELPSTGGAFINSVEEGSPAEKYGIQPKDVIIDVNGRKIDDRHELRNIIGSMNPGEEVSLTLIRAGSEKKLNVKLGEYGGETIASRDLGKEENKEVVEKLGLSVSGITSEVARRFNLDRNETGVVITEIDPYSVAASFGLRDGDVIKEIGNVAINGIKDYKRAVRKLVPDKSYLFRIKRVNSYFYVAIKIPED